MVKKDKQISLISEERRTHDLQSVAKMLKPLAKNLLGKKGFTEIDILTNWADIVGEETAAYTLPGHISFKRGENSGGVLHIEVPSGAFALELQHREKMVITRINAYFGYPAVGAIRIAQNSELRFAVPEDEDVQGKEKTLVTEAEENYIRKLSDGVENSELQQKLISLGRCIVSSNKGEK